jgi:hypothetical protein
MLKTRTKLGVIKIKNEVIGNFTRNACDAHCIVLVVRTVRSATRP